MLFRSVDRMYTTKSIIMKNVFIIDDDLSLNGLFKKVNGRWIQIKSSKDIEEIKRHKGG